MIDLSKEIPIGKGTNRLCFVHPQDKNKCIKVTYTNNYKESEREVSYYKFIEKQGFSLDYLPKYYGKVKTSMGDGEVFELIKDYNGKVSRTLTDYVKDIEKTKKIQNPIILLKKLREYCIKNKIIIKDLNSNNIMYQKIDENNVKLIIIDGFSNPKRIQFLTRFNYYVQKKQLREWDNFFKAFFKRFNFNTYLLNLNQEEVIK